MFASIRNHTSLASIIVIALVVFFIPFLVDLNAIIAASHDDNAIASYRAIANSPDFFCNDPHSIIAGIATKASLMFYGPIWLSLHLGVPIKLSWLIIQFIQFGTVPVMYAVLFVRYGMNKWALVVFFGALLSGFYCWNLGNYGIDDMPTPHQFALPFLCLGGYYLSHGKKYLSGTMLMVIGCLIHVWMGVFAITVLGLYFLAGLRKCDMKFLKASLPVLLSIIIVIWINYDARYATLTKNDIMPLLLRGMHEVPWDSPWRWQESWKVVAAFSLLSLLSFRDWGVFGDIYKRLLLCATLTAFIFSILQLAGVWFEIPLLLQTKGLRSVTIAVIVFFPVVIHYLCRCIEEMDIASRFFAILALLMIVFGANYGLDKFPVVGLMVCSTLWKRSELLGIPIKIWTISILGIAITWCMLWMLGPQIILLLRVLPTESLHTIQTLMNLLFDTGAAQTNMLQRVCIVGGTFLLLSFYCIKRHFLVISDADQQVVTTILLSLFAISLLNASWLTHIKHSGAERDLYLAQIWANQHTPPTTMFIINSNNWRSFSERPALYVTPRFRHAYINDNRLKMHDDMLLVFLGLQDYQLKYKSPKDMILAVSSAYNTLDENRLKDFADRFGGSFLVETRTLNFPVVYANSTYSIYKIR